MSINTQHTSDSSDSSSHFSDQVPEDIAVTMHAKMHHHIRSESTLFSQSLQHAYEQVLSQEPFALVDLPFSEEDRQLFETLQVPGDTDWNYFGSIDDLPVALQSHFQTFTNDASLQEFCANRIAAMTHDTLSICKKDAAWVCVRSMPGTDGRPLRWHTDGTFFTRSASSEPQMKLAYCLCGESTYFADLPAEQYALFRRMQRTEKSQDVLNTLIPSSSMVIPATAQQGALFVVGSEYSGVHSEPPMHVPRIFVSVVPGMAAEIEEWKTRKRG